jgi:hypothetical protein
MSVHAPNLKHLKIRARGKCALCGADGQHQLFDGDFDGLVCDACTAAVLRATAFLLANGFERCTNPAKNEPNN